MITATRSGAWKEEEDQLLIKYQAVYGNRWSQVCQHIPGRTGQQCAQRWRHKVNPQIVREKWTPEEDRLLTDLVQQLGVGKWASIARQLPGRTDQQCMGRWRRHLDPNIRKDAWTAEEDAQLRALYLQHGPAWSCIAKSISKRTPQQCRGRWCILAISNSKTPGATRLEGRTQPASDSEDEEKLRVSAEITFAGATQAPSRPSSRSRRVLPESDAPLQAVDLTLEALPEALQETPSKEIGVNHATRIPTKCRRRDRLQRNPAADPQDNRNEGAAKPKSQEEGVEQSGITILSCCRRGDALNVLSTCRARSGHCFPHVGDGGNVSQPRDCASAQATCTDTEASTAGADVSAGQNEVPADVPAGVLPPLPQPSKQVESCQGGQPDIGKALPAPGGGPDWSQIAVVSPTSSLMSLLQAGLIQTPTCSPGMFPNPDILCAPVPPGMPKVKPTLSNGWSDVSVLSWSELRNCKDDFGQTIVSSQVTPDNTRPLPRLAQDVNQTSTTPRRDMFARQLQFTTVAGSLWRPGHGLLDDGTSEFEGTAECHGVNHSLATPSSSIGDPGALDGFSEVDTHRAKGLPPLPSLGSLQTFRPPAKAPAPTAVCNVNIMAGAASSTPTAGYSFLPFVKKPLAAQFSMPPGLAYAVLLPPSAECARLDDSRASSRNHQVLADQTPNVVTNATASTVTIPAMDSRCCSLVCPLHTVSQPAAELGPCGQLPRLTLQALEQPRQNRLTSLFPVLKLADIQGQKFAS